MDQTEILAGQIFNPKNRFVEGRILSGSEGIVKALTVYKWPNGVSNDDKLMVLSYLTAYGKSNDESPTKWATWMYSYIVLCFDNMVDLIKREGQREYSFVNLPRSFIDAIVAIGTEALEYDGSESNAAYTEKLRKIVGPTGFPFISPTVDNFPDVLAGCRTIPAVYGYCALLIFMSGKRITDKNLTTITERRPQNLIDTYGIPEGAQYFLIGEGRMDSQAHKMCNQAWVTYAFARRAIITDVAAFASGNSLPQRIVYTVSKLLENVGMQSAYYIHRFLQAFPEAREYACIRPSLGVYAASIREVARADSRIQPYYKVIHGDLTRAFHRNGLLTLAACAISFEKTTSPSMRNYGLGEGATMAVNMFDTEASARGNRTLGEYTNVTSEALANE